jgi:hypothetical protein
MPKLLSVQDCLAELPIKMAKRSLVQIIRAAGPDYYQEWRRQLFLTPEQWAVVVAGIKPPCSKSSGAGRGASFKSSVGTLSPEAAFEKARALCPSPTRKRNASSSNSGYLMSALTESVRQLPSQKPSLSIVKRDIPQTDSSGS